MVIKLANNPQTLFNWGYRDAQRDVADNRPAPQWEATNRADEIYQQGYLRGWAAAIKKEKDHR